MGLDPENPDYEPGNDCVVCNSILFDDVTPKYVEAELTGIEKCPGALWELDNGVYLLTQNANACRWLWTDGTFTIMWFLEIDKSTLLVTVPGFFWFKSIINDSCYDAFVNENVCEVGPVLAELGYVLLWWGPTIGP